jgi:hypothetical protein
MNIDEQIFLALMQSDPNDLPVIRRYVAWVRLRRRIHDLFYTSHQWVLPDHIEENKYHWVGRRI